MQQFAGTGSTFTWWTFAMILAPAVVAGALLVRALAQSLAGRAPSPRLVLAPLLMLGALLDPEMLKLLVTTGEGGGAIWVVTAAMTGGYGLTTRGRRSVRVVCRVVSGVLLLGLFGMGASISSTGHVFGAPSAARNLWGGLLLCSLGATFAVAASWPWRAPGPLRPRATVAFGALLGLAWAASLRGFMSDVSHWDTGFDWLGTYVWILLPGVVIGALLAYSSLPGARHRGWIVASPLLFASVLVPGLLDPGTFLQGGIGAGTFAVPLICMIGGASFTGRGPLAWRVVAALVLAATIPVWALTADDVGGGRFGLDTLHGLWAALFYWSLLATFSLAASLPQRVVQPSSVPLPGPLAAEVTSR
jgi:hypothetical protein